MKKILVVGWDKSINNFGDIILIDTASYLAEMAGDVQTIRMDWSVGKWSVKFKVFNKFWNLLLRMTDKFCSWDNDFNGRVHYAVKKYWYKILLGRYYKSHIKKADAVMIAGGGVLKFETQDHSFYTERLLIEAARLNIPVMINAAGIEGYSSDDIRCSNLIKCLNNSTIKVVTTRDDIETLKKHFVYNGGIITGKVADPAYWIPEVYCIKRNEESDLIGINLIRENIFKDYGKKESNDELYELYYGIVCELNKKGYKWKLFCNGIKDDYEFGLNLIDRYKLNKDCLAPISGSVNEYVKLVSGFKAVIAGRMHATIASFSLGIPVCAFVWSNKMKYFADDAGIGQYFLEDESISAVNLVNSMERAIGEAVNADFRNNYKQTTVHFIRKFCEYI